MKRAISIRLRITSFLVVAIVVTLGSATWLLDSHIDTEVARQADTNLVERAQALSDIYSMSPRGDSPTLGNGRVPEFLADDGVSYFKIQCNGRQTLSAAAAASLKWPPLTSGKPVFADLSDTLGTQLRGVVLPFKAAVDGTGGGAASSCSLGLAVDMKAMRNFQNSMDHIEFGCILLGILIVLLLTPWLIRRGLQPLSRLAEAVQMIGPESPERRLDTHTSSELEPLIMRFNEVLARMEEGLMRERQFASGVAHELRTPLAELRTMIEVELRYPSGRDLRAFVAELGLVGNEMERLVTALLLLTRIEAGIEQVQFQRVDIGALTGRLLDRYRDAMQKRQLALTLQTQEKLLWEADPTLLEVTLGNLLGNAVTYAPPGTSLVLGYQSDTWWLQNDAPELDPADLDFMHRRFWRKGRDTGVHTGLGVALVAASASAQSMHLSLTLNNGRIYAAINTGRPTHAETRQDPGDAQPARSRQMTAETQV